MKFLAILTVLSVLTDGTLSQTVGKIYFEFFPVTKCDKLPRVYIPSLGKIEGSYGVSLKGRTFSKFEGVPYAQPPVGRLRFRVSCVIYVIVTSSDNEYCRNQCS
jgi:hypothetical protein